MARTLGVSPRRLHGWEPTETHRGYDLDGNRVPLAEAWEVVVTREPEWSDEDRNRLLELDYYETGICRCGYHESLTTREDLTFTPHERKCPVCAGLDKWSRRQRALEEQVEKNAEKAGPMAERPSDGRFITMRLLSPDEVAAAQISATQRRRPDADAHEPSRHASAP